MAKANDSKVLTGIAVVGVLVLSVCVAQSQSLKTTPSGARLRPPATDPKIVLEQARTAVGGEAWAKVSALHIHSILVIGGRDGDVDTFQDTTTGRFLREIHISSSEKADGFDGVSVWTQPTGINAYVYGDADSILGAIDESFRTQRGWWFPERRPATCEYVGAKVEGDRAFDIVRITPEGGRPFVLWIDRATHLIDRDVEQQAEQVKTVRYGDYRWIGGIRLPYTITRSGDTTTDQLESVQSVEFNAAIPDTRFSLPVATPPSGPDSVTIPFRLENNEMFIDVSINGKGPFEAEFDSGGDLAIPPTLVTELALPAGGTQKVTGGGEGSVTSMNGIAQSISIGAAMINGPRFLGLEVSKEWPRRILVGHEILAHYVVHIDFDKMTMTLTRPDIFQYRGRGSIVPFHFQDNEPEVLGSVDGIAGAFTIDTGADGSLLLIAPFARRYGLVERYHAVIPYGGSAVTATHGVYGRANEVALNGEDGRPVVRVSRPITRISLQDGGYDADRYVSGNIEMGILKQFNVTFDYARQHLIFEPNLNYGKPEIFNGSGLRLKADDDDGWAVTSVYAGSAAERAGVRKGDRVLSINGKTRADLDHAALLRIFTGQNGTPINMTLRSNETKREVSFELRDVL